MAAKKKEVVSAPKVELPKELVVENKETVSQVVINTPLGLKIVVSIDNDGDVTNVDINSANPKVARYTCSEVETILEGIVVYTDAQFEELITICRAIRAASKKNKEVTS